MNTYQGIITKKEFVKELKKHQKADAFLQGTYESTVDGEFKGCAVGCSLKSIAQATNVTVKFNDHTAYPKLLGIPTWLAKVEDRIFEGLSVKDSKTWPVEFAAAIPENVDLDKIKGPFLIMVLERALTKINHKKNPEVKKAIEDVITLWRRDDVGSPAFKAAATAAGADAYTAAATATGTYADTAAAATAYSVDAATGAYAYTAAATTYAAAAIRRKEFKYFAKELIKLLKKAK